MRIGKSARRIAAALVLTPLLHGAAHAQFGARLPQDDFTWVWGDRERAGGFDDFSISGSEASFRCDLSGKLSASSRLSPVEVRSLENDLRTSLFFIQSAANTMNILDRQRDLDWAVLDCTRPGDEPETEADLEARAEREEEARQRAVERMLRRREREQRRNGEDE